MDWLTVEVFDAGTPASQWADAWRDALVGTAIASGAVYWDEHEHSWGVVLEFCFADEMARDRFRQHPTLLAALDAAPNPVTGALVYPHRGGGTGARVRRRPRPHLDEGAAALPLPEPDEDLVAVGFGMPEWVGRFDVLAV